MSGLYPLSVDIIPILEDNYSYLGKNVVWFHSLTHSKPRQSNNFQLPHPSNLRPWLCLPCRSCRPSPGPRSPTIPTNASYNHTHLDHPQALGSRRWEPEDCGVSQPHTGEEREGRKEQERVKKARGVREATSCA
jgi:hypothetical protein